MKCCADTLDTRLSKIKLRHPTLVRCCKGEYWPTSAFPEPETDALLPFADRHSSPDLSKYQISENLLKQTTCYLSLSLRVTHMSYSRVLAFRPQRSPPPALFVTFPGGKWREAIYCLCLRLLPRIHWKPCVPHARQLTKLRQMRFAETLAHAEAPMRLLVRHERAGTMTS
jgi:hypothetical protein